MFKSNIIGARSVSCALKKVHLSFWLGLDILPSKSFIILFIFYKFMALERLNEILKELNH